MKKIILILTIIMFIFVITGCPSGDGSEMLGSTRKFWAQTANGQFYQLEAQLLAENTKCEVWVEKGSGVDAATAQSIAIEYSNNIYNKMMDAFGNTLPFGSKSYNVMDFAHLLATGESDGKFTILLLDIKDGYNGTSNTAYVAGYFFQADLLDQNTVNNIDSSVKTNQRDMIYIDTNPGLKGRNIETAYSTLAHEMQHLMNFIFSYGYRVSGGTLYTMDTWINEGLSSAAEWVYSGEHGSRVDNYNDDISGLIAKGNNFFVWDNREGENQNAVLDDYSTVYLFFQWLRLQGGMDIYKDIIKSVEINHQAVTDALNSRVPSGGYSNNWSKALETWLAANYIQSTSSQYGYKNDSVLNSLKKHYAPTTSNSISLYPGEGVYSSANSYPVPAQSGSIKYAGLNTTLVSSGTITGTLLTYNANTDNGGGVESGTVTGARPPVSITMSKSSAGQSSTPKGPFPIGMQDALRRNGHKFDFSKIDFNLLKGAADE